MEVPWSYSTRRAALATAAVLASACASAHAPVPDTSVPHAAGTLAASTTCRVTGAWNMSGESVPAPSITRCVLPWYPGSMRTANQEGDIVFRITVDSAGLPDSSSLHVIRASASALVSAVQAAAPYLRFSPDASRPVIVVEMPYTFTLRR